MRVVVALHIIGYMTVCSTIALYINALWHVTPYGGRIFVILTGTICYGASPEPNQTHS